MTLALGIGIGLVAAQPRAAAGGNTPPANAYVAEDNATSYTAEDGATYYIQES